MKTRAGTLIKKGGAWYLIISEMVGGRQKRTWLATGEHDKRAARRRAEVMTAPFLARNRADRLANLAGQIDTARATATALEDAINPGIDLNRAFDAYARHPDHPAAGDATLEQYRNQWGRFEKWVAENHPNITQLRQVTSEIAIAFMQWIDSERVSPNTFNKYRGFLRLLFRVLAKDGRVTTNPFDGIKTRRLQTFRRRALTVDELRAVCGAAEGEMRLLLALGLYTGARMGDCATMQWAAVDFKRGTIEFAPRKTARWTDGKKLRIPLHPALAAMLTETVPTTRRGHIVPESARLYLDGHATWLTQKIQAHFRKCGIQTAGETNARRKRAPVECGFHSLRHTAVTMLRDAGAPMAAVMAITGHSSAALLDHYTHAGDGAAKAAIGLLPAITGGGADCPASMTDAEKLSAVRKLVDDLTVKNWRTVREEVMKVLG